MSTFEFAAIGVGVVALLLGLMAILADRFAERRHRTHHKHA